MSSTERLETEKAGHIVIRSSDKDTNNTHHSVLDWNKVTTDSEVQGIFWYKAYEITEAGEEMVGQVGIYKGNTIVWLARKPDLEDANGKPISNKYRNLKLGDRLMKLAENHIARSTKEKIAYLNPQGNAEKLISYYKKHGYVVKEEDPSVTEKEGYECTMYKHVEPIDISKFFTEDFTLDESLTSAGFQAMAPARKLKLVTLKPKNK